MSSYPPHGCGPLLAAGRAPLLLPAACALAGTAKARPVHATLLVAALAGLSLGYGTYLVTLARMPL